MTLLGNPTRKRGLRRIFLAYVSGYHVFKQHQIVVAALMTHFQVTDHNQDPTCYSVCNKPSTSFTQRSHVQVSTLNRAMAP